MGISSGLAHPPFCDLVFFKTRDRNESRPSVSKSECLFLFEHCYFFPWSICIRNNTSCRNQRCSINERPYTSPEFSAISALFLAQSSKMTFDSLSSHHAGKYHTCQAIIFPVLWTSRFIVNWFESIFVIRQVSDLSRCELRSRGIPFIKGNNWRMLVEYVALETSFPRTCVHLPHSTLSKT